MRHLVSAVFIIVGCGGSSPPGSSPPDLGAPLDLALPAPSPRALLDGNFGLVGLTGDGRLLIFDRGAGQLSLLPENGGAPSPVGSGNHAVILDGAIAVFDVADSTTGQGPLGVFTDSAGLQPLSSSSSTTLAVLSADGQRLLYFDGVSSDGATGDLVTSGLDGSGRTVVAAQIPTSGTASTRACFLTGNRLGSGFVVSYCKSLDTASGAIVGEIAVVDPAQGSSLPIVSDAPSLPWFVTDATHAHALAQDAARNALWFDASASPSPIAQNLKDARFAPDGTLILVTDGAVSRYTPSSQTTSVLQSVGGGSSYSHIVELSSDGSIGLLSRQFVASGTFAEDLWTVPLAAAGGSASALLSAPTGVASDVLGGSSFTRDSRFVFFESPVNASYTGPLQVAPAAGGPAAQVADGTAQLIPTHDSSVVACVDAVPPSRTCDLIATDATQPDGAVTLDSGVVARELFLSSDRSTLFYAVEGITTGIYALAVP